MVNVPNTHIRKLIRSVIRPLNIEVDDAIEKLPNGEKDADRDWETFTI